MDIEGNTGLPKPLITREKGRWLKQVLFNSSGYVRPKEMVAILGPSGSGKTSLLNVIGQRTGVSQSSFSHGSIKINGRELGDNDFGKVGAYIQ